MNNVLGCGPSGQQIVRAVPAASDDLTRSGASLAIALDALEARLKPVLSDTGVGSDNTKPPQYPCELAQSIQREACFVQEMADKVNSLLSRLEI